MQNPALGWEAGRGKKSRLWLLAPEPSCFAFADFPIAATWDALGNAPAPEPGTVSIYKLNITFFFPPNMFLWEDGEGKAAEPLVSPSLPSVGTTGVTPP